MQHLHDFNPLASCSLLKTEREVQADGELRRKQGGGDGKLSAGRGMTRPSSVVRGSLLTFSIAHYIFRENNCGKITTGSSKLEHTTSQTREGSAIIIYHLIPINPPLRNMVILIRLEAIPKKCFLTRKKVHFRPHVVA